MHCQWERIPLPIHSSGMSGISGSRKYITNLLDGSVAYICSREAASMMDIVLFVSRSMQTIVFRACSDGRDRSLGERTLVLVRRNRSLGV